MSLPPPVNTDKSSKHRAAAMKEPVQHSGEVYYGMGPPALESTHSDSSSSSGVYNPEKGPQNVAQYQQTAPGKWIHQDSLQAPGWSQEASVQPWGQNFGTYMAGVNVRGQVPFHKGAHDSVSLAMAGENQLQRPVEVYRDATRTHTQGRGLEWEQHAAAAMHQAQLQAYQHGHKGADFQVQPHAPAPSVQASMLQPFQTTFRPNKQQFSSGYYFPGNKGMQSLAYNEQPKSQQQLLHQMQQQQMHHQQQQQQQLQQQHQLQLQQQHLQQQQHQIQQHQIQQQQMQQMQQFHQQQLQKMQQQQLQQQNVAQEETAQLQVQSKLPQTQNFVSYQPPEANPPGSASKNEAVQSVELQQEAEVKSEESSVMVSAYPEKVISNPSEPLDAQPGVPRRSRRLSREGQSPQAPPSTNIWGQASKEPLMSQNGVAVQAVRGESQGASGGVIQSTRRKRRASKEINLETLAQKASEMPSLPESLPAKKNEGEGPLGRQATMVPLVIPVSVPVHRGPMEPQGVWSQGRLGQGERAEEQSDHKPSVIVARRRSRRTSLTENNDQDGDTDPGLDEDGKSKFKRRPRPEPLIIPPPKPATFIPPSVYSSITSYQSNLRSPVRLPDNPLTLPPYTPPPILSPVREGSGLYFSTFLTNIAVSNQILPPPATPKSAARSLLRSTSSEITPPILPMITDATPVSLEPRINIGLQYQAEIPELQDQLSSQLDEHKADLVWVPLDDFQLKHVEYLMNMACSSVLIGGGTNQELVLHCLHESGGDFLETLGRLMYQDPIFPKGHQLAGYHYSGSDNWTAEEKHYFNKGISAYRKDFFLVQKLVRTKTVAQCVEFYYTYKKQVKIARNGISIYGPPASPLDKYSEAVVDIKSSQHTKPSQAQDVDNKMSVSSGQESSHQARVAQSLQVHDYAGTLLVLKEPGAIKKEVNQPTAPHKLRGEPVAKKGKVPTKPAPQDPDMVFPCKKCNRVFNKVKSRSAHMKSHAEQEKKAAALRLREEEEQAAAAARARKAAAASAAMGAYQSGNGIGATDHGEISSQEDSSVGEDDNDEDWH